MPRSPRPWFRFYSESLDNPKLQRLDPTLFKLYINLLCYANQASPRGSLGRVADVAFRLRTDIEPTLNQLAELKRRGLLDGGWRDYRIHDWSEWQPDSDAYGTPGRKDRNHVGTRKERATSIVGTHRVEEEKEEEIDQEKEGEREVEEEAPARRNIFVLYDNFMGKPALTQQMRELLIEADETYPPHCIEHCFQEAAASSDGRRSWAYVKKILERHERDGCNDNRGKQLQVSVRANGRTPIPDAADELERRLAQL